MFRVEEGTELLEKSNLLLYTVCIENWFQRSMFSQGGKRMAQVLFKRAYTYRLYPTKKQAEKLQWTLDQVRALYNAALQERRDAYDIKVKRHPNYYDEATRKQLTKAYAIDYNQQANQLPALKALREEYQEIHSQVLQDVLRRVDKAFKAFFRRVKEGHPPGYPRFQGDGRYNSFTFPQ